MNYDFHIGGGLSSRRDQRTQIHINAPFQLHDGRQRRNTEAWIIVPKCHRKQPHFHGFYSTEVQTANRVGAAHKSYMISVSSAVFIRALVTQVRICGFSYIGVLLG
jgi:hypothetical protein